jgi:hypothetical protein
MRVAFALTAAFVLAVDMPGTPQHNEHSSAPRCLQSPSSLLQVKIAPDHSNWRGT